MNEVILKRFESPDETRPFEKGKFELIRIGGMIEAGPLAKQPDFMNS
jgi:hypothetical protein